MLRMTMTQFGRRIVYGGLLALRQLISLSALPSRITLVNYAQNDFQIDRDGTDIMIDIDDETSVLINYRLKPEATDDAIYLVYTGAYTMAMGIYLRISRYRKLKAEAFKAEFKVGQTFQMLEDSPKLKRQYVQIANEIGEMEVLIQQVEKELLPLASGDDVVRLQKFADDGKALVAKRRIEFEELAQDVRKIVQLETKGITVASEAAAAAESAKKLNKAKKWAKALGIDLGIFLGTLALDVVLSDEQEEALLESIDSLMGVVGIEDFTDTYGISLPTSPSDIFLSVVLKEGFDLLLPDTLGELDFEQQLVLLLSSLATNYFIITVKGVFAPINIDVSPEQVKDLLAQTMTQKVIADPYLVLEGWLIAFALKCIYTIYVRPMMAANE